MFGRSKPSSLIVFELVNENLREIYVGRTFSLFQALGGDRPNPVPRLAHWDPKDVRPPRKVASGLNAREAKRFIDAYVRRPLPEGWRFVT